MHDSHAHPVSLARTATGVRNHRSRAGRRLAETRWAPVRDKSEATLAEPVRSGTRNRPEAAARHGQTRSLIISSLVLHTPPCFVFFRRRVTRGCCPSFAKPLSPSHRLRGPPNPPAPRRVLVKTLPSPNPGTHQPPGPASSDLGNPHTGQTQRAGPCTAPPLPPCLSPLAGRVSNSPPDVQAQSPPS